MLRVIGETLGGLLLAATGVYLGYLYLASLQTNGNILFLALSLLLTAAAIFLLVRAGKKAESTIMTKPDNATSQPPTEPNSSNILQRNNEIAQEWSKTMNNRDRLKLLQISANAEQQK